MKKSSRKAYCCTLVRTAAVSIILHFVFKRLTIIAMINGP